MELIGVEIFIKIHFAFKFSVLILKNLTLESLFRSGKTHTLAEYFV